MLRQKTKIIATIGPSITYDIWTWSNFHDPKNAEKIIKAKNNIKQAILNGVNVFRLNFSHGQYEEQEIRLTIIKEVSKEINIPVSLLLDTKGPEIRIGPMPKEGVQIKKDDVLTIHCVSQFIGNYNSFSACDSTLTYNMANDVKVGDRILIDDGKLILIALTVDVDGKKIIAKALNDHLLNSNKRINLPSANYSIPFFSEKDAGDISFAIKHDFDYIALSFVNNKENIEIVRKILKEKNSSIKLISKIETQKSLDNFSEILEVSDGIMIARGDLSLETLFSKVPYHSQRMIELANYYKKPIIMATQMLDNMEKSLTPTRAEVSDVYWASLLGVDSTMLSGETAQGKYPLESIATMEEINFEASYDNNNKSHKHVLLNSSFKDLLNIDDLWNKQLSIEDVVKDTVLFDKWWSKNNNYKSKFIFINSDNYEDLKLLSFSRIKAAILFPTKNWKLACELNLFNSLNPIIVPNIPQSIEEIKELLNTTSIDKNSEILVYFNNKIEIINV